MVALLLATLASAAPNTLVHQGRLLDDLGTPLTGTYAAEVSLYSTASGGTPVWTEANLLQATDGYYTLTLGDTTSLTGVDFAGQTLWVGITPTTGVELAPRTELSAVPVALSVRGGGAAAQSGPLVFGRGAPGSAYGWVSFPRPLPSRPIIVTSVIEFNNSGPTVGRFMQITRNGFGIATYDCSTLSTADALAYLAMEPGSATVDGHLLQAGETGATSGSAFSITFPTPFTQLPAVFLNVDESRSNSGATACRVEALTNTSASGRCWSTAGAANADSIHWIALEPTGPSGIAIGDRKLYAGLDDTPVSSDHNITLPFTSEDVPEVVLLQPENFGTSGGPASTRLESQSVGNTLDTRSWLCATNTAAATDRMHWLVIE